MTDDGMLIFSTSDKGGTGRSVTSCNLAYQMSILGRRVAYLDFDFGSPTSGALFEINKMDRGTPDKDGLHEYLTGNNSSAASYNIWKETNRKDLRSIRHPYTLMLYPGDRGGGEFASTADVVNRCVTLLRTCRQEFEVIFVDLSAGRSAALEIVLTAMAAEPLRDAVARWLVFHRWTRQHILAANGLVHGPNGLLQKGTECGHDAGRLLELIRYVRTAVPPLSQTDEEDGRGPQWAWLRKQNQALEELARLHHLGSGKRLGSTPMEPVLQWREQLILTADVDNKIAKEKTIAAFQELAQGLVDPAMWTRIF